MRFEVQQRSFRHLMFRLLHIRIIFRSQTQIIRRQSEEVEVLFLMQEHRRQVERRIKKYFLFREMYC